jgi:hypothetical protein
LVTVLKRRLGKRSLRSGTEVTDPIDRLRMPASAVADLAWAVPTDVVKGIVSDHYQWAAPTPKPQPSVVDKLLERFAPKAD